MSSFSFPKLKLKQFPLISDRESAESKYWKSFIISHEDKLIGAPNTIHFDPSGSGQYLVTSSTRVSLFDPISDKIQRAFTRFEDEAFSGKFRKDGKLLVAGDKSGSIKVMDVISKSILRQMKGHLSSVRATNWTIDGLHFISGSDDKHCNVWDLALGTEIWSTHSIDNHVKHTDYIRSVDGSPIDQNIVMTGSYDHQVCLWDIRQRNAIQHYLSSSPITSALFTSSGTLMISASSNEIQIRDIVSGGKILHTFSNHQKDISSLCLDAKSSKLFSTGLDGHLKVYNIQSLQMLHGLKFGSPLLSCGLSPNGLKLVVGYVDGRIEVRNKSANDVSNEDADGIEARETTGLESRKRKYYKGAGMSVTDAQSAGGVIGNEDADGLHATTEAVVDAERLAKLRPYEAHLKKFNYQLALDAALRTRNPVVVITVLEELCRRSGLVEALSGRNDLTLEPLLSFLSKYIVHPKYSRLLITVSHTVLDLYASALGHSDSIDELVLKLQRQIQLELMFQKQVMRVSGSLDGIVQMAMRAADESHN